MQGNDSHNSLEDHDTNLKNILIVEDDPLIRETLQEVLEIEGYTIYTAENGKVGLEAIRKFSKIQLILLDLMMPEMNGFEFLDIRMSDPVLNKIPVIVVSAFPDQAQKLQVDGFVKKPIDLDRLLSLISNYLKQ